jgi:hypothetical protein
MPRSNCLTCVGVLLALFGAAILVIGLIVTPKEFPVVFNDQLDDYLVVDSEVLLTLLMFCNYV